MKKWMSDTGYHNTVKKYRKLKKARERSLIHIRRKHVRKFGPFSSEKKSTIAIKNTISEFFKRMSIEDNNDLHVNSPYLSIKAPKNFCFIHHPGYAIKFIHKAHCLASNRGVRRLNINHSASINYNLTSEVLLGLGIEASKTQRWLTKRNKFKTWRQKDRKLSIDGILPKDADHKQLINEIGVVKEINAQTTKPTPYSKNKQHLFSKHSVGTSIASAYSNDDKTRTAEKFCQYVNKCVKDHNLCLTQSASHKLLLSLSEVLDNAERHSSRNGSRHIWHARGYLNSESNSENLEISVFNFGMTIADTFSYLSPSNYGKKLVLDYVNAHRSSGFSLEQLTTIAALQHRYSSKNVTQNDTNGQGTIALIEFFERLCDDLSVFPEYERVKPEMSIVSGKTHILFDGTCRLTRLPNYTEDDTEQLIIAFNKQNSLKFAPDSAYVKKMSGDVYFPGVAISIRVPLKEEEHNGESDVN